jgi:hypothetical protein
VIALLEHVQDGPATAHFLTDPEPVEHQHRVAPERDPGADLDLGQRGSALEYDQFRVAAAERGCGGQAPDSCPDDERARRGPLATIAAEWLA